MQHALPFSRVSVIKVLRQRGSPLRGAGACSETQVKLSTDILAGFRVLSAGIAGIFSTHPQLSGET
jgi:hypothetical protein